MYVVAGPKASSPPFPLIKRWRLSKLHGFFERMRMLGWRGFKLRARCIVIIVQRASLTGEKTSVSLFSIDNQQQLMTFLIRDEFEGHRQSHIERQQRLHAGIAENGLGSSIRARKSRHGVLRAPEVLLSLAGKTLKSMDISQERDWMFCLS